MATGFLRKIVTLSSGIAVGQGVLLLFTPVLSRIYTPADFGLFGILVALASILAVGSNGRYFLAIVQPEDDDEASSVLALAVAATGLFAAAVAVALAVGRPLVASLLHNPGFGPWWWWVPVATVLAGWFDAVNYWHIRRQRYGLVSRVQPVRAGVLVGGQAGLGALGAGFAGLAWGRLVADFVLLVGLLPRLRRDLQALRSWRHPATWIVMARRFREFPQYSAPQGWLSAVAQYLPVLVLAVVLDNVVVGMFLMTQRILATPNQFLGKALRQVFYQQLHQGPRRHDDDRRFWWRTTRAILLWALAPTLAIVVFGPPLFTMALGPQWTLAGQFARPVVVWQLLAMACIPSQMLLMAQGRQRTHLVIEVIFLAVRFVALVVGARLGGALGAVTWFSLVGALMQAVIIAAAARRPGAATPEAARA
ncbi:MAG: oligosaccharide flippase family protein [Candidatus Krumholzibacteriia bacterium]